MSRTCSNQVRDTSHSRAPRTRAHSVTQCVNRSRKVAFMLTLLYRLYRMKLLLVGAIFTAAGLLLLLVASHGRIPELGFALITSGSIAAVLELSDYHGFVERLKEAMTSQAATLRDAVIDGFATSPEKLTRVASPATLDEIMRNCLAARVVDPDLAADLYAGIRRQIAQAAQPYRANARGTVHLRPWRKGPQTGFGSLFEITIQWAYTLKPEIPPVLRFAGVTSSDLYRELTEEVACLEASLIYPDQGSAVVSRDDFELLQCTINRQVQRIHHSDTDGNQIYTVIPDYPSSPPGAGVHVSHTHRILVAQHGHRLFVDFPLARGLQLDFTYSSDSDIRHLDALDYTAGTAPHVEYSPPNTPAAIRLDYGDHWIYPRSGVSFSWILHREVGTQPGDEQG